MRWLKTQGYRGVSLRDLARYIDPTNRPADAWAVVEKRQAARKATQTKPTSSKPEKSGLPNKPINRSVNLYQ